MIISERTFEDLQSAISSRATAESKSIHGTWDGTLELGPAVVGIADEKASPEEKVRARVCEVEYMAPRLRTFLDKWTSKLSGNTRVWSRDTYGLYRRANIETGPEVFTLMLIQALNPELGSASYFEIRNVDKVQAWGLRVVECDLEASSIDDLYAIINNNGS